MAISVTEKKSSRKKISGMKLPENQVLTELAETPLVGRAARSGDREFMKRSLVAKCDVRCFDREESAGRSST